MPEFLKGKKRLVESKVKQMQQIKETGASRGGLSFLWPEVSVAIKRMISMCALKEAH